MYSTTFVRGTVTPLQTLRMVISSLGSVQSLFDSQVTFVQVLCFSQEHTVTGRLASSTSSVRYQVPSLSLPFSRCTLDKTV